MYNNVDVLIGIFAQCGHDEMPADSLGIHTALNRLNKIYPDYFKEFDFIDGVSQRLDIHINNLLCNGFLGLKGKKLETLIISQTLKDKFNQEHIKNFNKNELETMGTISRLFPLFLRRNGSVRYKRLVTNDVD